MRRTFVGAFRHDRIGPTVHCNVDADMTRAIAYRKRFKAEQPDVHRYRKQNPWSFQPPNGESHAMVHDRIRAWLDEQRQPMVIAGHGVVGRVLRRQILDLEPDEAARYPFPQDKVFVWRDGSETLI